MINRSSSAHHNPTATDILLIVGVLNIVLYVDAFHAHFCLVFYKIYLKIRKQVCHRSVIYANLKGQVEVNIHIQYMVMLWFYH